MFASIIGTALAAASYAAFGSAGIAVLGIVATLALLKYYKMKSVTEMSMGVATVLLALGLLEFAKLVGLKTN